MSWTRRKRSLPPDSLPQGLQGILYDYTYVRLVAPSKHYNVRVYLFLVLDVTSR